MRYSTACATQVLHTTRSHSPHNAPHSPSSVNCSVSKVHTRPLVTRADSDSGHTHSLNNSLFRQKTNCSVRNRALNGERTFAMPVSVCKGGDKWPTPVTADENLHLQKHFDPAPKPVHLSLPHSFWWYKAQLSTAMYSASISSLF